MATNVIAATIAIVKDNVYASFCQNAVLIYNVVYYIRAHYFYITGTPLRKITAAESTAEEEHRPADS